MRETARQREREDAGGGRGGGVTVSCWKGQEREIVGDCGCDEGKAAQQLGGGERVGGGGGLDEGRAQLQHGGRCKGGATQGIDAAVDGHSSVEGRGLVGPVKGGGLGAGVGG